MKVKVDQGEGEEVGPRYKLREYTMFIVFLRS